MWLSYFALAALLRPAAVVAHLLIALPGDPAPAACPKSTPYTPQPGKSGPAKTGGGALYSLDFSGGNAMLVSQPLDANGMVDLFGTPARTAICGGKGYPGAESQASFAQGSVVVSGSYVLAVLPLSNALALFSIPKDKPWQPVQKGPLVSTGGVFPVSVTVSPDGRLACVLNANIFYHTPQASSPTSVSVSCFSVPAAGQSGNLRRVMGPIALTPYSHASLRKGSIAFNPAGTALLVAAGSIYAFSVKAGVVDPVFQLRRPGGSQSVTSVSFAGNDAAVITDSGHCPYVMTVSYPGLGLVANEDFGCVQFPMRSFSYSAGGKCGDIAILCNSENSGTSVIGGPPNYEMNTLTGPADGSSASSLQDPQPPIMDVAVAKTYLYLLSQANRGGPGQALLGVKKVACDDKLKRVTTEGLSAPSNLLALPVTQGLAAYMP